MPQDPYAAYGGRATAPADPYAAYGGSLSQQTTVDLSGGLIPKQSPDIDLSAGLIPKATGMPSLTVISSEPLPPKGGILERYWEGLKSAVPALGGQSDKSPMEQLQNAHIPTWAEIKANFNASPVGKMVQGDVAGGLGAATPLAVMGAIGSKADAINEGAPAAVRGVARGVNAAMDAAPAIGTALGTAVGHDVAGGGWTGPAVGGIVGNLAGRVVGALPRVPGENFGAPPPSPEATGPIPAGAYKAISQTNPQLNDGQIRAVYQNFIKSQPPKTVRAQQPQPAQDAATQAVDAVVPAGPINDAATEVAGSALTAGNAEHAQAVIDVAQNLAKGVSPKVQAHFPWEDTLDDRAWSQRMQAGVQDQEASAQLYKGRMNRMGGNKG